MLQFEWGVDERDEDLRMIAASSITGINLASALGLMNAYYKVISCGTATMVIDVFAKFGNIVTNTPIEGLLNTNLKSSNNGSAGAVYNITDNANVVCTMAESSTIPGRYTLTFFASVTVGDDIQVLFAKNGLDFTGMIGTIATVTA